MIRGEQWQLQDDATMARLDAAAVRLVLIGTRPLFGASVVRRWGRTLPLSAERLSLQNGGVPVLYILYCFILDVIEPAAPCECPGAAVRIIQKARA